MRKRYILYILILVMGLLPKALPMEPDHSATPERIFNVRDFGARGNGSSKDTKALQNAIHACAQAGAGRVLFPPGTYLTGTLFLKSHVHLYLEKGAVLSASISLAEYPRTVPALRSYTDNYTDKSLIYGENLEDVGIGGAGTIDGHGGLLQGPSKWRPYLLRFVGCRGVDVEGITLKDSAMWAQHYLACDDVRIEGITVRNRCNINNDGIDIDSCQRVRISRCDISSEDDAIVLKSTLDRQCRDVVVTRCRLSSDNNALKLGTESTGGFADIRLSACEIYNTRNSGIALEVVDGGVLERVDVSDLTMHDVEAPIFIRLGNRARRFKPGIEKPGIGLLRNVRISNVTATGANRIGCSITGLPNHPAQDIRLENVRITFDGGTGEHGIPKTVGEHAAKYPEYSMFGMLPAYGFFCRHVSDLQFSNVHLDFSRPDERPSLFCDDVQDLQVSNWKCAVASSAHMPIRLVDVRNATVDGQPAEAGPVMLAQIELPTVKQVNSPVLEAMKTKKLLGLIPLDWGSRVLGLFGAKNLESAKDR